ncbi:MAG: response regulator transcription factor [Acidobacteriota bacterium]
MMPQIRVVIADHQIMVREGIHQLLLREHDLEIVAEAADEAQMKEVVEKFKPDILLLNDSLLSELDALESICNKSPQTRILFLTEDAPEKELLGYIRAGAKGAISKRETGAALAKAIRVVAAGESWAGRKALTLVIEELSVLAAWVERPQHVLASRFTPRELLIAECVAHGRSNRDIAEQLRLSEKTVKNHLSNIFQKFGLRNRTQLTALILRGHQPAQRK